MRKLPRARCGASAAPRHRAVAVAVRRISMSGPPVKRQLTDKEIDILRWMRANGDSNRKIAEALGVSSRPVKRQIYMDIAAGIVQRAN
jgi:DNA-binding NarL/FixJ family response regulator